MAILIKKDAGQKKRRGLDDKVVSVCREQIQLLSGPKSIK